MITTGTARSPSPNRPARVVAFVAAGLLLLTACTGSDQEATRTTTSPAPSVSDPATTATPPKASATTTTAGVTSTTLAGAPIDFGPRAGDVLAVIGVAHDDVLNVRAGPGVDTEIVDTLDPLTDDLTASGITRHEVPGFWIEVDTGDAVGWVSLAYVGYLGVVDDRTSQVIEDIGERPRADTLIDLGAQVAETFASDEPASDIVQVTAPSVGDLGEITFDVIGIGDDAGAGFRVHVFGQPDEGGESFGLMSAEVTTLCSRGVTDDLLCT